ncbi:Uncharacterised protein [uncultured archaeon]|nr:Uncharacterised protein [uncultured archaeon]
MTNLRQRLNSWAERRLGKWAVQEVNPKQLVAGALTLGCLGTASPVVAADEPIIVGGRTPAQTTLNVTAEDELYHNREGDTLSHWFSLNQENRGSLILYVDDNRPIEGPATTLTKFSGRIPFARGPLVGSVDPLGQIRSQGDHAEGIDARATLYGVATLGGAVERAVIAADGTENFVNQGYGLARVGPVEFSAAFSNRSDIPTRTSGIGTAGIYLPVGFFVGGGVEMDGDNNASVSYVFGRAVEKPGQGTGFRLRGFHNDAGLNTLEGVFAMDSLMGPAGIAAPIREDNGMALDHRVFENWNDAHPRMPDRGKGPVVARATSTWNQLASSGSADVLGQIPVGDYLVVRVGGSYTNQTVQGTPRIQTLGPNAGFAVNNVAGMLDFYGYAGANQNLRNGSRDFRSIFGVSGRF